MIIEKSIYSFLEEVKSIKILLIDDDISSQYSIAKSLEDLGENVDFSSSANDALINIDYNYYDLILVDLNLPEINGFELSKTLKKATGNVGYNPRIIGITQLDHPLLETLVCYSHIDDYAILTEDYNDLKGKIINQCYLHQN